MHISAETPEVFHLRTYTETPLCAGLRTSKQIPQRRNMRISTETPEDFYLRIYSETPPCVWRGFA